MFHHKRPTRPYTGAHKTILVLGEKKSIYTLRTNHSPDSPQSAVVHTVSNKSTSHLGWTAALLLPS